MKTYKIYKGCHYSNFFPRIQLLSKVSYMSQSGCIVFDESCKYEIAETSCVNKLFGFCFGFGVHENSIRFGWTYNAPTNQIYIWKYFYINGKLEKEKIFACEIGESNFYEILANKSNNVKNEYLVTLKINNKKVYPLNDSLDDYYTKVQSTKCFITTLGPYFGGNTRAPHTMKIEYYGREMTKTH